MDATLALTAVQAKLDTRCLDACFAVSPSRLITSTFAL